MSPDPPFLFGGGSGNKTNHELEVVKFNLRNIKLGRETRQTPTTEWRHVKEAQKCLDHWNAAIGVDEGKKVTKCLN